MPTPLMPRPHILPPSPLPRRQREAVDFLAPGSTHLLWGQEIPFPAGLTELQEHRDVNTGFFAPPLSPPSKVSPTHKLPQINRIAHFP